MIHVTGKMECFSEAGRQAGKREQRASSGMQELTQANNDEGSKEQVNNDGELFFSSARTLSQFASLGSGLDLILAA